DINRAIAKKGGAGPESNVTDMEKEMKELDLRPLSTVKESKKRFLWKGRIPIGRPTIIAGDGDTGKTFALTDVGSWVTTGRHFPDGTPCEKGVVIHFSSEDGAGDVLRPRYRVQGADLNRVIIQGQEAMRLINLGAEKGFDALEYAIKRHKEVRMVVFDPITAF